MTITNGPFAGEVAQGQCGRCDGIGGDPLGFFSDSMGDGVDRDIIIIASGKENKVAILDVSSGIPEISIVSMRDDTELTPRRYRY